MFWRIEVVVRVQLSLIVNFAVMALPSKLTKFGTPLEQGTSVNTEKNLLRDGFSSLPTAKKHPLEQLEKSYALREETMNMAILKKTQGIGAPLKLMMERKAASEVNRLPFLPSSNLMKEVLGGKVEDLGFESFLGDVHEPEAMGHPHLVVEKSLNCL